jgi:Cu-Zn family superoxide dismutase
VNIHNISAAGIGATIGSIRFEAQPDGLRLVRDISGLPPGLHAFHLHETASCDAAPSNGRMTAGMAAGGHFQRHDAMSGGMGHHHGHSHADHGHAGHSHAEPPKMAGDLPDIMAGPDGRAVTAVRTPALDISDVYGRALMVHVHANAPKDPAKTYGGGARIACAVIPR